MPFEINRKTAGVELPKELSTEIWGDVLQNSVVQQLATKTELPSGGLTIQTIDGEPEAAWVGETDKKPVATHKFGSKKLQPYKMALIEPFSDEFARDLPALYRELARRLPYALGRLFDKTVFGEVDAPGENFDTLKSVPEVTLDGTINPYFTALKSVADNGGDVTAWALNPATEIEAMQINDGSGRPLLVSNLAEGGSIGSILGRPVQRFKAFPGSKAAGFAGEWSQARWGQATPIMISQSSEATIETAGGQTLNLWQHNMFALRVEVEVGFNIRDPKKFVKLSPKAGEAA